jgi:phosphoglycerol transferase MdoB-like AlkP superfamily enzyme
MWQKNDARVKCHVVEKGTNDLMTTFMNKYMRNSFVICVALSILLNLFVESVSRRSLLLCLAYLVNSPLTFLLNTMIIFVTFSFVYFVKRRVFVYVVVSLFWVILGVTNGILLSFRSTPFTVSDLSLSDDGFAILPNYVSTPQLVLGGVIALALIIGLVLVFIFAPKHKQKTDFKKSMIGLLIIAATMYGGLNLGISSGWVSTYFGNLNTSYRDYGFPYCFANTWLNTGISMPENYSKAKILGIFKKGELEQNVSNSKKVKDPPNIIMVQLESFIDPTLIKGLKCSQDPIPNFRKLEENYSTGYLTVPVTGAGTANTEFEAITGMNLRFFGPGEFPYKTIMKKKTVESIPYDLMNLGYATHAIHNHTGAFYGRNIVFPKMGFQTFTSVEYMNNVLKNPRGFEKDTVLTGEIMTAMKSTKSRDYVYSISVEGHGRYPTNVIYPNPEITVSGIPAQSNANAVTYYIQQVHDMDAFIGQLTKTLQSFPEHTILVIYGDHQPSLNLTSEDMANHSLYQTQYVIWSNYKLTKKDQNLAAYQIGAETLKRAGISAGTLTTYHQNYSKDKKYAANLKALQYDMLYGNQYIYGGINPFLPTKMKMGIKTIKVDAVININGKYYIKGQNFTPFSKISIDGKILDTIYLTPTVLGLLYDHATPADALKMKVSQVDSGSGILSTTE